MTKNRKCQAELAEAGLLQKTLQLFQPAFDKPGLISLSKQR